MRLAITLRRCVAVVQVCEECPVRRSEILPIQAQGIEVKIILKTHEVRPSIHCIDSRSGKGAVESIDGACRQALRAGDPGWRNYRCAAAGNRLHQRRGKRMLIHLQPDVILVRILQRESGHADALGGSRYAAAVSPELVRAGVWNCGTRYSSRARPRTDRILSAGEWTRRKNTVISES